MKTASAKTNTKRAVNFTTTLPYHTHKWLSEMSKNTRQRKNEIIVSALALWEKEYSQARIAESYKSAMQDSEWVALGNSNIDSWV